MAELRSKISDAATKANANNKIDSVYLSINGNLGIETPSDFDVLQNLSDVIAYPNVYFKLESGGIFAAKDMDLTTPQAKILADVLTKTGAAIITGGGRFYILAADKVLFKDLSGLGIIDARVIEITGADFVEKCTAAETAAQNGEDVKLVFARGAKINVGLIRDIDKLTANPNITISAAGAFYILTDKNPTNIAEIGKLPFSDRDTVYLVINKNADAPLNEDCINPDENALKLLRTKTVPQSGFIHTVYLNANGTVTPVDPYIGASWGLWIQNDNPVDINGRPVQRMNFGKGLRVPEVQKLLAGIERANVGIPHEHLSTYIDTLRFIVPSSTEMPQHYTKITIYNGGNITSDNFCILNYADFASILEVVGELAGATGKYANFRLISTLSKRITITGANIAMYVPDEYRFEIWIKPGQEGDPDAVSKNAKAELGKLNIFLDPSYFYETVFEETHAKMALRLRVGKEY